MMCAEVIRTFSSLRNAALTPCSSAMSLCLIPHIASESNSTCVYTSAKKHHEFDSWGIHSMIAERSSNAGLMLRQRCQLNRSQTWG